MEITAFFSSILFIPDKEFGSDNPASVNFNRPVLCQAVLGKKEIVPFFPHSAGCLRIGQEDGIHGYFLVNFINVFDL